MSDKQRIGFVGVGLMGHGMAKHLLGAGHPLTILGHRNRQPVDDLVGRGAREACAKVSPGSAIALYASRCTCDPILPSLLLLAICPWTTLVVKGV